MDINAMDDLVRKCSPYQFTEVGKIMLLESEAKSCVDELRTVTPTHRRDRA